MTAFEIACAAYDAYATAVRAEYGSTVLHWHTLPMTPAIQAAHNAKLSADRAAAMSFGIWSDAFESDYRRRVAGA